MATMMEMAKRSAGNVYYYPEFNANAQGMKFTNELYNSLTRAQGWESVFRIRTSQGFNQVGTFGNITVKRKTADLLLYPSIDKDRVLVYEIER